jgi:5-methylcytosine-specific restriction endonuclease McrA
MAVIGVSSFCSYECLNNKREKSPKRKPMQKKPRRSGNMDSALRRKVCSRDHQRCRGCLQRTNDEVHHIRYRSEGTALGRNSLDNLVLLCKMCHLEVHSNKRIYQPALIQLVNYLEEERNLFDMTYHDFIE